MSHNKLMCNHLPKIGALIILLIVICGIALLAITHLAFREPLFDYPSNGCIGNSSPDEVAAFAQIEFPTSAKNISMYSEQALNDCFVFIRFQISASETELEQFIASTYIDKLVFSSVPSLFSPLPSQLNWTFDFKENYWSGEGQGNIHHAVVVVKDETQFTVYFVTGFF